MMLSLISKTEIHGKLVSVAIDDDKVLVVLHGEMTVTSEIEDVTLLRVAEVCRFVCDKINLHALGEEIFNRLVAAHRAANEIKQ